MKQRHRFTIIGLFAATTLILLAACLFGHPKLYSVTILPSLGGRRTEAYAINDRGQVVGLAQVQDGEYHFFLWDRANGTQDLGVTGKARFDINNAGQIAGTMLDADGGLQSFLWESGRGRIPLGTLGGRGSLAWAINDRGQIVGFAETPGGSGHAFLWDRMQGMQDLGTLGGTESQAHAVNDAGEVFGLSHTSTAQYEPFIWDSSDGMTAAGPAAIALRADFADLNNGGWIVGAVDSSGKGQRMIMWRKGTGVRELFPLEHHVAGPVLLNDANQVVFSEMPNTRFSRIRSKLLAPRRLCYLWDPQRGRISLDSYIPAGPREFFVPMDINNRGCIVGFIRSRDGRGSRAVLLEPIRERWGK